MYKSLSLKEITYNELVLLLLLNDIIFSGKIIMQKLLIKLNSHNIDPLCTTWILYRSTIGFFLFALSCSSCKVLLIYEYLFSSCTFTKHLTHHSSIYLKSTMSAIQRKDTSKTFLRVIRLNLLIS